MDDELVPHVEDILEDRPTNFHFNDDDVLCFKGRIVVPNDAELRCMILTRHIQIRL